MDEITGKPEYWPGRLRASAVPAEPRGDQPTRALQSRGKDCGEGPMPIHDWSRVPAGLFHHFHQHWAVSICDALNAGRLPKGYSALIDQSAAGVYPDVITLERRPRAGERRTAPTGIAVAAAPPKTRF